MITMLQRRLRGLHHFVTAGCAWANGSVERANREALRVFRTLLAEVGLPHGVAGTGTGCTGDGECYGEHSPSE